MEPIDFDDIDALNAAASEDFGSWGREVSIPQDLVDAFADLTDDHQWIHVDVERCGAESPFGAPIAHGFLVLSLMRQSVPRPIEVKGHKQRHQLRCGEPALPRAGRRRLRHPRPQSGGARRGDVEGHAHHRAGRGGHRRAGETGAPVRAAGPLHLAAR